MSRVDENEVPADPHASGDGSDSDAAAWAALGADPHSNPLELGPPGPDLERLLADLAPVRTRRPLAELAMVAAVGLVIAAGLSFPLRADLGLLPGAWVAGIATLWLAAFAWLEWSAVVPAPRSVMPPARRAGGWAMAAMLVFPAVGLALEAVVPGVTRRSDGTAVEFARRAAGCLLLGLAAGAGPTALAVRAVRGCAPADARWLAAGLGAAGGTIGGLALHFHCPYGDRLHVGLAHGGLVACAAGLAALLAPRVLRP